MAIHNYLQFGILVANYYEIVQFYSEISVWLAYSPLIVMVGVDMLTKSMFPSKTHSCEIATLSNIYVFS